jgi:RHS repeat-associated protein
VRSPLFPPPFLPHHFDYDAASRITQIDDVDGSTDYTYDKTNQLTAADASYRSDESYSYDDNGNRTNTGYQTGTNNQLTSDGTYTYTYDDEGNLIQRVGNGTTRSFSWDYRNRLTSVTENGGAIATYTYDVMDRRITKTAPGSTTQFVYDGDNVILEFNGTATLSVRYLQGLGVDQVLAQEQAGNVSWMLTDHLGTVRDLVNNAGSVVNHFTYDSFGKVLSSTPGGVDTRYKYTGRELDQETGLYYYRARYFDANVGRFIGQDPIGFSAGDNNLYRYVGNEVTNHRDPSGKLRVYYLFSDVLKYDVFGRKINSGQNHIDLHILTRDFSLTLGFDPDRDRTRDGAITYKPPVFDNFANNPPRSSAQIRTDSKFMLEQTQLIYEDASDLKCEKQKNKDFIRAFQVEGLRIHHAKIPYRMSTTNSNAAMYTALTRTVQNTKSFNVKKPKYSSPGWGVDVYKYQPRDKLIYG